VSAQYARRENIPTGQILPFGDDSATGKKMVPGIPSSVIEPLVLRRGTQQNPGNDQACSKVRRNKGPPMTKKAPPSLAGLNQKDRDGHRMPAGPGVAPVHRSNTTRKWPRRGARQRFSAAQLCCNCLRRKGNTAWATTPGSSANGQCPLSGKIFISARGKTWR
jgi:hypothetical protein